MPNTALTLDNLELWRTIYRIPTAEIRTNSAEWWTENRIDALATKLTTGVEGILKP